VDWILGHFRGRTRPRTPLVCYLRENGPIAYSTDLLAADPRERVEAMLATGLTWFWKAAGPEPISRDWTHLTRWSLAALLADVAAVHGGVTTHILIAGVDDSDTPDETTDARVAEWMRGFAAADAGPLHAVVTRPAAGGELLFVAQQPPESIRGLLQAWGISRDKAQRKAYARLHGQALEDLIRALRSGPGAAGPP
jgi:hypothetical protein